MDIKRNWIRLSALGVASALLALFWLAGASVALAQGQVTDDDVNSVAKQLFCPVCENEPLDQCGTKACQDWRAEIRLQLESGATEQDIKDDFQQRYGDRVLAEPPREGINWVLWLLPVAFVIFGGIWFGRYLNRLQVKPAATVAPVTAPATPPSTSEDDYIKRVEDELRRDG